MEIGKEIRRIREMRGYTQADLELKCGMKREYLSRLESGKLPNPTPATLKKILDVMNYKLSALFREIGE